MLESKSTWSTSERNSELYILEAALMNILGQRHWSGENETQKSVDEWECLYEMNQTSVRVLLGDAQRGRGHCVEEILRVAMRAAHISTVTGVEDRVTGADICGQKTMRRRAAGGYRRLFLSATLICLRAFCWLCSYETACRHSAFTGNERSRINISFW